MLQADGAVLPQRRRQGDPQQLLPPARPADHRGERRPVLRLPHHARLRPGRRRLCSTPTGKASSIPPSPCGPASSSRRSDSSGSSRPPTSPSPSAASRPTSPRTATSASRSAATSPPACSPTRSASSTACPTSATATATCNDSKDLAARVFFQPFKTRLAQGPRLRRLRQHRRGAGQRPPTTQASPVIAARRSRPSSATAPIRWCRRTPSSPRGGAARVSPHAYLGLGSLGVLGEFTISSQEVRRVSASAKLTHNGVAGERRLLPDRRAGRLPQPDAQEALRPQGRRRSAPSSSRPATASSTSDDDAFPIFANPTSAASKAKGVGLGVNWHLNKQIKVVRELRAHHVRGRRRRWRSRRPRTSWSPGSSTPSEFSTPCEAG